MNLNEVSVLYKDAIDNYSEVVFNNHGGVGLPSTIETVDKLTKSQEDFIGKLWSPLNTYTSGNVVSSDNTTLYISLVDNNTATLDDPFSWKVVNENYFEDGEINIVASAYLSYRPSDEVNPGNGLKNIVSHNLYAEGVKMVRFVYNGSVDENGYNVRDEEVSYSDIRIVIKSNANIEDDKYSVFVSCPFNYSSSGNMAYKSFPRVINKTKSGFTICATSDKYGSIDWKPGDSGNYSNISIIIIK